MRYDLKHLSTFIAVAEELNFHRAAERLTMAQPAVSRIVVELEDRLGVKLLERTTRRVRLTESGRYLFEKRRPSSTGSTSRRTRSKASSLTGIPGLVTAGSALQCSVAFRAFLSAAIESRPIVTVPQTTVETHLAWRRSSVSGAMRRFVETSELIGRESMTV